MNYFFIKPKYFIENRSHLRYTISKIPPTEETLSIVRSNEIYQMEREFYDFAVNTFENILKRMTDDRGQDMRGQQFHYEKIKS